MEPLPITERTRVRRLSQRASHDPSVVHGILDAAVICHVGYASERGPVVIPTAFARHEDAIVLHGSSKSSMLLSLARGADACCEVSLLDGLVLARSAFHHSVNYRSAIVYGRGEAVEDADEKLAGLRAFFTKLYPGRWEVVRPPTVSELKATLVVRIPIAEAVAKIRTGPPIDDAEDYALPVWAGVVPITERAGASLPDAELHPTVDPAVAPPLALFAD